MFSCVLHVFDTSVQCRIHTVYMCYYSKKNVQSVLSVLRGGVGDEEMEKGMFVVKPCENNCTKDQIHALTPATAVISNIYPPVCEL